MNPSISILVTLFCVATQHVMRIVIHYPDQNRIPEDLVDCFREDDNQEFIRKSFPNQCSNDLIIDLIEIDTIVLVDCITKDIGKKGRL